MTTLTKTKKKTQKDIVIEFIKLNLMKPITNYATFEWVKENYPHWYESKVAKGKDLEKALDQTHREVISYLSLMTKKDSICDKAFDPKKYGIECISIEKQGKTNVYTFKGINQDQKEKSIQDTIIDYLKETSGIQVNPEMVLNHLKSVLHLSRKISLRDVEERMNIIANQGFTTSKQNGLFLCEKIYDNDGKLLVTYAGSNVEVEERTPVTLVEPANYSERIKEEPDHICTNVSKMDLSSYDKTRQDKIKEDYKELTAFERYRVNEFSTLASKLNDVLGLRRNHDKAFFFEVDHCTTIKENGTHNADNLQILTQQQNATKNRNSTVRMTFDEQKEYIIDSVKYYCRNKMYGNHDYEQLNMIIDHILKCLSMIY